MKFFKKMLDIIAFVLACDGPIADEMVNEGLLDKSGQGRDKYGK